MERTTAVFHERDRVDEAVRELTHHGIAEQNIYIEPAPTAAEKEPSPRTALGLPHRLQFGAIGAIMGMVSGLAVSGTGDTLATLWLVIFSGLIGGLIGSLVGLLVGALRKERFERKVVMRDWLVRVEADDATDAEHARRVLTRSGGEMAT